MVASGRHRNRWARTPLAAQEQSDQEEREQYGRDGQADDAEQAPGPSAIIALVAARLGADGADGAGSEDNREDAGGESDRRHPEKDERHQPQGPGARRASVRRPVWRDAFALSQLVERGQWSLAGDDLGKHPAQRDRKS